MNEVGVTLWRMTPPAGVFVSTFCLGVRYGVLRREELNVNGGHPMLQCALG